MTEKEQFQQLLVCECHSFEHQIIISYDEEENCMYCTIHLSNHGFWRRIKEGFKYIFGHKSVFGEFDEFVLSPRHANTLREIADKLESK